MTITMNLTERAAANLFAQAQDQGRPQAALIAEVLEERFGGKDEMTVEDDLYSAAARYALSDGSVGRTYTLDENQLRTDIEIATQVLEQSGGLSVH